jgi:hypothetical protein
LFDALGYLVTELPQHFVAIGLLNDALDAALSGWSATYLHWLMI